MSRVNKSPFQRCFCSCFATMTACIPFPTFKICLSVCLQPQPSLLSRHFHYCVQACPSCHASRLQPKISLAWKLLIGWTEHQPVARRRLRSPLRLSWAESRQCCRTPPCITGAPSQTRQICSRQSIPGAPSQTGQSCSCQSRGPWCGSPAWHGCSRCLTRACP